MAAAYTLPASSRASEIPSASAKKCDGVVDSHVWPPSVLRYTPVVSPTNK